jgi:hypothetical protein
MIRNARTGLLRRDHPASRIRALPTARHDQLQLFDTAFRPAPTFTETIAIKTDVFEIGNVSPGSNLPALCRSISGLSGAESTVNVKVNSECSTVELPGNRATFVFSFYYTKQIHAMTFR